MYVRHDEIKTARIRLLKCCPHYCVCGCIKAGLKITDKDCRQNCYLELIDTNVYGICASVVIIVVSIISESLPVIYELPTFSAFLTLIREMSQQKKGLAAAEQPSDERKQRCSLSCCRVM